MTVGSTADASTTPQQTPARSAAPTATHPAGLGWRGGATRRQAAGDAAVALGMLLLAGLLVGAAWAMFAPTAEGVVVEAGVSVAEVQSARFFAAEGLYAVVVLAAGAVTALLAHRWLAGAGAPAVITLAVGGLLAGLVAARVGVLLGPDPIDATAGNLGTGSVVLLPLRLQTTAMLLLWPIATVFVALWTTVLGRDPDPPADARHAASPPPASPA